MLINEFHKIHLSSTTDTMTNKTTTRQKKNIKWNDEECQWWKHIWIWFRYRVVSMMEVTLLISLSLSFLLSSPHPSRNDTNRNEWLSRKNQKYDDYAMYGVKAKIWARSCASDSMALAWMRWESKKDWESGRCKQDITVNIDWILFQFA